MTLHYHTRTRFTSNTSTGTRREFLKAVGLGSAVAALTGCFYPARRVQKPHIAMFLSDDHGADFVGCYGNKAIQTPNIDALAKQGMYFTNMFAASPTCAPSRSVIYTGLYPARNGAMGNHSACKPGIKSLPSYLKMLGYRVVLANKTHIKPKEVFDFEYLKATLPRDPTQPRRYRQEGLDTRVVDQFLAAHARDNPEQPLCIILADNSPHVTWEYNKTYDPAKLPIPPYMVDTAKTRVGLANYYQDITTMDKRVGDVMISLKKYGYEDNTLFIYTSDQGPEWPHCKWTVYDTGLRTPFIVRWPGKVEPGAICDAMTSFVDITPTFIDIAGGPPLVGAEPAGAWKAGLIKAGAAGTPQDLDGRSFQDVLLGKAKTFRDKIFASHTGDGTMNVFPQRCVRSKRYKYVLNLRPENTWTTHFTKVPGIPNSHKDIWDSWIEKAKTDTETAKLLDIIQHHPAEELYDVKNDPYELNNIADKPEFKLILEKMRDDLKQWLARQGDTAAKQ